SFCRTGGSPRSDPRVRLSVGGSKKLSALTLSARPRRRYGVCLMLRSEAISAAYGASAATGGVSRKRRNSRAGGRSAAARPGEPRRAAPEQHRGAMGKLFPLPLSNRLDG